MVAVGAGVAQQFMVGAALSDPPVIDYQDKVGVLSRSQPLGDDEGGAAHHDGIQRLLYQVFVSVSTLDVASSRISTRGSTRMALAMDTR